MLEDVPKEKLINAVPFYTRLWIEAGDGSITSKAMGIADAKKWVDNNQVELTWQADTAQYYGEKQTNDGAQFLWMEEERSLKEKMNVVRQNDLAGVACWNLGLRILPRGIPSSGTKIIMALLRRTYQVTILSSRSFCSLLERVR